MSGRQKYKDFLGSIKPFGLYAEVSSKHLKIMKNGRLISSMSLTPSEKWVAIDQTLRYLIKGGHLPKVNRTRYVSELKRLKNSSQTV